MKQDATKRVSTCLYCDKPPNSLEHIIPQALGGRLARRIICGQHNAALNVSCDEPLVKQFQYFVHALRVVTERRDAGIAVIGKDASGKAFRVDADHKPRLVKLEVLERDAKGVPTHVIAPNETSARKFVASMGLDPAEVPLEARSERPQTLNFSMTLGGVEGFRGILKIAYEYVVGHLDAKIVDRFENEQMLKVLLNGADPAKYVRWLPYEYADALPQAGFFSHRVVAAPDDGNTVVLIEMFSSAPFVVRLPGILLNEAHALFQGLMGELPFEPTVAGKFAFCWNDVPESAQPLMFSGFQERVSNILRTMQISGIIRFAIKAFAVAAVRNKTASDDDILATTLAELSRVLPPEVYEAHEEAVRAFVAGLLPLLRSGEFNPAGKS